MSDQQSQMATLFKSLPVDQLLGISIPESARSVAVLPALLETDPSAPKNPSLEAFYRFDKPEVRIAQIWLSAPGQTLGIAGVSGSGKSSWVRQLAIRLNRPCHTISCSPEDSVKTLLDKIPMTTPGSIIVLDDIDLLGAKAKPFLKQLIENEMLATMHDKSGYLRERPWFNLALTSSEPQINLPDCVTLGFRLGRNPPSPEVLKEMVPSATMEACEAICNNKVLWELRNVRGMVSVARRLISFGDSAQMQLSGLPTLLELSVGFLHEGFIFKEGDGGAL